MGYEELIENAKVCCGDIEVEDCIEHCKNPCDKRGEELRWCRQWLIHDLHTAITDLLARAEAVDADNERLREALKINCLLCESMHPDNGNCTEVGGFCTAVPAAHCPLIPRLMEEADRLKDLLKETEARAEKAEKCLAEIKSARAHTRPAYVVDQILKKWSREGG